MSADVSVQADVEVLVEVTCSQCGESMDIDCIDNSYNEISVSVDRCQCQEEAELDEVKAFLDEAQSRTTKAEKELKEVAEALVNAIDLIE